MPTQERLEFMRERLDETDACDEDCFNAAVHPCGRVAQRLSTAETSCACG